MLLLLYSASKSFTTIANQKHKINDWIMRGNFFFNIYQVRFIFSFSNSGLLKIKSISQTLQKVSMIFSGAGLTLVQVKIIFFIKC